MHVEAKERIREMAQMMDRLTTFLSILPVPEGKKLAKAWQTYRKHNLT
jgi:hypothetical protein